jgi:protein-L-isoaspartate O-methyltransferase
LVARARSQADCRAAAALAAQRFAAPALAALLVAAPALAQEGEVRAPFITTPPEVVARMLRLAGTVPRDFVIDLGSGDGRIVIAAAREHQASGLGVELEPALVEKARENARLAGVEQLARFEVGDALKADVSRATVVTVYLLPSLLEQLQPRLLAQLKPGARVVTHAFTFKGWPPDRTETVRISERHEGQGGESRIYLWIIPAQARGAWAAPGGWQLRVHQNYQLVEVDATLEGRPLAVEKARLQGTVLEFSGPGFAYRGRVEGDRLRGVIERGGARDAFDFERVQ